MISKEVRILARLSKTGVLAFQESSSAIMEKPRLGLMLKN